MSESPKSSEERYHLLESVGEGANGTVYRALDRQTGETVAVKVINLEESNEPLEEIQTELTALIGVNHRFLVKYHNSFIKGSELNIVMEYMDCGSLGNLLQEVDGVGFDEATIAWIMKEMWYVALTRSRPGKHQRKGCGGRWKTEGSCQGCQKTGSGPSTRSPRRVLARPPFRFVIES
eukprot:scaffold6348_cov259-Pinguiococcus_pyrenoidosus.AAC.1